jgi:hypothetical protein
MLYNFYLILLIFFNLETSVFPAEEEAVNDKNFEAVEFGETTTVTTAILTSIEIDTYNKTKLKYN